MIGEPTSAEVGSPITVVSLPKTKVSSQILPAIGSNDEPILVPDPVSQSPQPVAKQKKVDNLVVRPLDEQVTVEKVLQQVRIYIQA